VHLKCGGVYSCGIQWFASSVDRPIVDRTFDRNEVNNGFLKPSEFRGQWPDIQSTCVSHEGPKSREMFGAFPFFLCKDRLKWKSLVEYNLLPLSNRSGYWRELFMKGTKNCWCRIAIEIICSRSASQFTEIVPTTVCPHCWNRLFQDVSDDIDQFSVPINSSWVCFSKVAHKI
jgi:hypothetical protein